MTANGSSIKAGIMGWPVGHSLSPRLHGYWLKELGINGSYVAIEVAPEDFIGKLHALANEGFAGVNVTVPHKEAAAAAVDDIENFARRIGAVNTIVVGADGRLKGFNTDGFGFSENLDANAPGWAETGIATVLGAGGAARAIVAAILDRGIGRVRLVNRTESRARALADGLGGAIDVVPWDGRAQALDGAGLLVNTTTLGMHGNPPLEIDLGRLSAEAVVTDIVYAPVETPLLACAAGRGNRVVDGLGMLLHQARPGFELWFGKAPEVTEALRAHVLAGTGR